MDGVRVAGLELDGRRAAPRRAGWARARVEGRGRQGLGRVERAVGLEGWRGAGRLQGGLGGRERGRRGWRLAGWDAGQDGGKVVWECWAGSKKSQA